jgi:hypothetical protein
MRVNAHAYALVGAHGRVYGLRSAARALHRARGRAPSA